MFSPVFQIEALYRQCLESTAGYRLHWPPDSLLQVGDFGTLQQNELHRDGNVQNIIPQTHLRNYAPSVAKHTIHLRNSDQDWMDLTFSGLSHSCIDDFDALEKNLIKKIQLNQWAPDKMIIGEIIQAKRLQLQVVGQGDYYDWANEEVWLNEKLDWRPSEVAGQKNVLIAEISIDALCPFYHCWKMIKNYQKPEKERNWDLNIENPDEWALCAEVFNKPKITI